MIGLAQAQAYPSKPIRLVHGFAPGSAIDVFSRPFAQKLSELLGQSIVVEGRPGATGTIANEFVAKSPADGYTLLAAPSSAMVSAPHLFKVRYNVLTDFTPIVQMGEFSFVLVAHPAVPVKSARDLIALAKARPGYLTFGSPGIGTGFHLAGELFALNANIKILHVPYRGGGSAALTDLVGGRLDIMWENLGVVLPYLRANRIKVLGVTGARRAAALPEAPTIGESGLPGYEIAGWHGLFAPGNLSQDIVGRVGAAAHKALASVEIKTLWATYATEINPIAAEEFAQKMRRDYDRYEKLIKAAGVTLQ